MARRDPAFQWETEMLRSSPVPPRPKREPDDEVNDSGDWLTVKEASDITGVPASTIRKWARHDNIPSFLERTSDGYLRIVSMRGIEHWTETIGRDIDTQGPRTGEEVDLTTGDPVEEPGPQAPPGTMIIPLDAWNRMLNQLGNLHEAGQQLAEARERAAKAETESRFLKERLADLRSELDRTRDAGSQPKATGSTGDQPGPPSPTSMARKIYDGWRSRRRRRS